MMLIKSLKGVEVTTIYKAFNEAFADYDALELNSDQFLQMITRRGFDPDISFGAFVDDRLVSFTLNGLGVWNGKITAYDTGTGTVKEHRSKGLANKVFEYAEQCLKKQGINQYLLEVLQHNNKAVNLYKKQGFEVSREFNYYVANKNRIITSKSNLSSNFQIRNLDLPFDEKLLVFGDYSPSWQNSMDSILRSSRYCKALGAYENSILVGYGITEWNTGDIAQLAVKKEYRRNGIATELLKKLIELIPDDTIKIINIVKEDESTKRFLNNYGLEPNGKQFEMIKGL